MIDDNDIKEISSMTSIGTIFTETKDGGVPLLTWVVFDDHEDTLIWDIQAIPGSDISAMADTWSEVGYTAGQLAIDSLDDPIVGTSMTIVYTSYELNALGIPEATGSSEATISYSEGIDGCLVIQQQKLTR